MKFITNFLITLVFISCISLTLRAQSWKPEPMKSAVVDKLIGTWTSEPHEFMGSTRTEVATHTMRHNGQYMVIDVSSKSSDGITYSATLFMTVDKDGNIKGWGFDDFGGIQTYTGKTTGDNKISVSGVSNNGTDQREIEITGDKMVHNVTFKYKDKEGKDVESKMTVTYNKNK